MFNLKWPSVLVACALLSLAATGCQTYKDQLQRGQGYYEQNQYQMALAVWRNLEHHRDSLNQPEVVRYCYFRGMTDFRLGYRDHARYWLGLAKAGETGDSPALLEDEVTRLNETLKELDQDVFGTAEAADDDAEALGDKCKSTVDCETGFSCQDGICLQAE